MHTDSYFKIGSSHPICQDFATSGLLKSIPYTIIADGCSGAKDSDWGARLLVRSLSENIYPGPLTDAYQIAGRLSQSHCRTLNLPNEALTATLLSVSVVETGTPHRFQAAIFGDGCIVARRNDGTLEVISHEFSTGAPYYLRYNLDQESHLQYCKEFGEGQLLITSTELGGTASKSHPINVETLNVNNGDTLYIYDFPISEYNLVAVLSDGVKSFEKKVKTDTQISTTTVPMYSILLELFQFKGYAGHFVQRRCIKQFKVFEELGWSHFDDFSIGVMCRD